MRGPRLRHLLVMAALATAVSASAQAARRTHLGPLPAPPFDVASRLQAVAAHGWSIRTLAPPARPWRLSQVHFAGFRSDSPVPLAVHPATPTDSAWVDGSPAPWRSGWLTVPAGRHQVVLLDLPRWRGVTGALPPTFVYRYENPGYHGWPVAPLHAEHPVRGSFLDARAGGYHFGVDVAVDDHRPDPGAPRGLSHRVYAVDGGVADLHNGDHRIGCVNRRLDVGHFSYWHVSPVVHTGERIRPGQLIGWTCRGLFHVHLSEWQMDGRFRAWVNPLHRGGKLAPYTNRIRPEIEQVRFFGAPRQEWRHWTQPDPSDPMRPRALHGLVEIRAKVEDEQSFLGWLSADRRLPAPDAPYRLAVEIRDPSGRLVLGHVAFQADILPPDSPWYVHFAPGTQPDLSIESCLAAPPSQPCVPTHWYRPLSDSRVRLWDTRTVPNGPYVVTLYTWDVNGNLGVAHVPVVVAN